MKTNTAKAPATEIVPLPAAPSGGGVEILAVTEDDFFLLDVRKVITLPNRVWHATSDTQAADMLMSTPYCVALIDTALMHGQPAEVVAKLREQFPDVAIVLAGDADHYTAAQDLIDSGEVQSFVAKPQVGRKLAKALTAGIDKHLELKADSARRAAILAKRKKLPMMIGGAVGGLAVLVLVAWLVMRPKSVELPVNGSSIADEMKASGVNQVELALQQARDAFEAGRYIDSKKNDSALDHYKAALQLDPNNAEAKDGLSRIAEVMLARAEASLIENKPRDAAASIKTAKTIEPNHPRIAFLEAQVAREADRSASATAANQQQASQANELSQQLANFIKKGNERLTQDKLIEPANDSAKYYFNAARDLDKNSSLAQQGLRTLVTKMLAKSNAAAARNEFDGAEQWIAQAKLLEVGATDIARAERELLASKQKGKSNEAQRLASLARERMTQGKLLEPENDSARSYLNTLKQTQPDAPELPAAMTSFRDALISNAEQSLRKEDFANAQRMVDEARKLGASGAFIDTLGASIGKARRQADLLATAKPAVASMIVKQYSPEYPSQAQRNNVSGYVDLNFIVNEKGEVTEATVVKAEPEGTFDEAAVRAVKRWKIKPYEFEGEKYSQKLAIRLRFQLDGGR